MGWPISRGAFESEGAEGSADDDDADYADDADDNNGYAMLMVVVIMAKVMPTMENVRLMVIAMTTDNGDDAGDEDD